MARHLPPLNTLRVFEVAARHLSFTKAGEELHVTPAAVSHHIRLLEEFLEFPLFIRQTRQLVLTLRGESLLPVVQQAFSQIAFMVERLRRGASRPHLSVRLPPYLSAWWLTPLLGDFVQHYPDIDLRLEHSTEPVDFSTGQIDLAVHWSKTDSPGITAETLFRIQRLPMCSEALHVRGPKLEHPADLVNFTLLHEFDHHDWEQWFAASGLDPMEARRGIVVDNYEVLFRAATEGQGVALLMKSVAREQIARANLELPLGDKVGVEFVYNLYYPAASLERKIVCDFRQWLLDQARASAF